MNVLIIPARGGSKRVKRKNIRNFGGRPIISYPIQSAIDAEVFDMIAVSTDDEEIAQISLQSGASAIIRRPPELADDHATTASVMKHAIEKLSTMGPVDTATCLYAPTPFVSPRDLKMALALLRSSAKSYAFSIARFEKPIWRALDFDGEVVRPFFPSRSEERTQDQPEAWRDAGQWYVGRASAWMQDVQIYGPWSLGVPVNRIRAIDIDTEEDFEMAELIWRGMVYAEAR